MSLGAGWRGWIAWFSLAFSAALPLYFAISAGLTKYGIIDYKLGFVTLTARMGLFLSIAALAVAAIAIIVSLIKYPRKKAFIVAGIAMLISASVAGRVYFTLSSALMFPPIHDIQTNWDDPVKPSKFLLEQRQKTQGVNPISDDAVISKDAAGNWPEFVGKRVSDVQEQSEIEKGQFRKSGGKKPYPTLETLYIEKDASSLFDDVITVIRQNEWELVTTNPEIGRIEATVTSPWFGFKDDIMIRLREEGEGKTQIDIRSTSRVGLSDLGANAKRIDEFSRQLRQTSGNVSFN